MTRDAKPIRYSTLKDGNWARLYDAANQWRLFADDLATKSDDFDRTVVEPLNGSAWHGEAGDAARAKAQTIADHLAGAQKYLDANAQLMEHAYDGMFRAWNRSMDSWASPPSSVTIDHNGRVSFHSAPESFPWAEPPIVDLMRAQRLAYQALQMAHVVNRKLAPLFWCPPNRVTGDIPPVATADANLNGVGPAWAAVKAELDRIGVDAPEKDATKESDRYEEPFADLEATDEDKGLRILLAMASDYLKLSGRPHGGDYLYHWLTCVGTTKYLDPDELRGAIPNFNAKVHQAVEEHAPAEGCFDTGWGNLDPEEGGTAPPNDDWWYAMNDFRFRVVGRAITVDGKRSIDYTVGVFKPYVFRPDHGPIKIPYLNEEITQAELARLHHVGLARNFIIQGLAQHTDVP